MIEKEVSSFLWAVGQSEVLNVLITISLIVDWVIKLVEPYGSFKSEWAV